MGLSRRKFTREFKLDAIERLESGTSVAAVARALEVSPSLLQRYLSRSLPMNSSDESESGASPPGRIHAEESSQCPNLS